MLREYGDIIPMQNSLQGTPDALRRAGESRQFLLDLDDTIATYDASFMKRLMAESIREHVAGIADNSVEFVSSGLIANNHYGSAQKDILSEFLDKEGISSFWTYATELMSERIKPDHVSFSPNMVKFINFVLRNSMELGVISNSTEEAGARVLDFYADKHNIALHEQSLFLGNKPTRKPSQQALQEYETKTGQIIKPHATAYIGNAISDLEFAHNIGAVGILLDPKRLLQGTTLREKHQQLLTDSLIISE